MGRGLSLFGSIVAFVLVLAVIAGLGLALAASVSGDAAACLLSAADGTDTKERFCAVPERTSTYLGIAALAGLILVTLQARVDGALAGAGIVLLGLTAAITVAPLQFGAPSGKKPKPELIDTSLEARLRATISTPIRIELADDYSYEGEVELVNGGLAAIQFILDAPKRIQIDVSGPDHSDPYFELYRGECNAKGEYLGDDDNGGSGLNSQLMRDLVEAAYCVIIRDFSDSALLEEGRERFTIKIQESSFDKLAGPNRTRTLTLGGEIDSATWSGVIPSESQRDRYRIDVVTEGTDACLVIDAKTTVPKPTSGSVGDTELELFDQDFVSLVYEDDRIPDVDYNPLIKRKVKSSPGEHVPLLIEIAAYEGPTPYNLTVRLNAISAENGCVGP